MPRRLRAVPVVLIALAGVGETLFAAEMWRAEAEPTSFVADWSNADRTDKEATELFLKHVWPRLKKVSGSLHGRIGDRTGEVYSGAMSPQERQAGVVCFPLNVEQTLPWYAVPTEKQVAQRSISTFAAQGQSEAVCIGVHALRDVKDVSVTCSDLRGPGRISASDVTSRLSLSYTMDPRGRGRIDTRQMLLLNVGGWDIPKAHTHEWIVDVHVPEKARPGRYSGKISVQAGRGAAAVFDLELEVLPFTLSDNGCRWGSFMTPNPGYAAEAWCDLNSRYGFNTLAWWNLDDPKLGWTWDGVKKEELILAKLRYSNGNIISDADLNSLPQWVKQRIDGPFVVFRPDEVTGIPREIDQRGPFYKKPMKVKAGLGAIPPEKAQWICYDRPGWTANFSADSINSVAFEQDDAFKRFDAGMKRLKKYGFAGPVTWFGAGGPTVPWETRLISMRFGQKYSRSNWKWRREVTPENSNHSWYLANAAVAKTFHEARDKYGWPEVVWCPCDESFQYKGVTGRAAPNMIGEMMPYIRHFAPGFRIYSVVWHKKQDNWRGMWQCGALQKDATVNGRDSEVFGPFQVICTNCPNDLDRQVTWDAGGEYWVYTFVVSTTSSFSANRFAFGFNGARHFAAVVYNFADNSRPHNLSPDEDVLKTHWITGQYTTNYYLAKNPDASSMDYAIASHAALACREGVIDRKYVETLRRLAYEKKSADDIAFLEGLAGRIEQIGGAGKGGIDDFTADISQEGGAEKLRREIAERIKALVTR